MNRFEAPSNNADLNKDNGKETRRPRLEGFRGEYPVPFKRSEGRVREFIESYKETVNNIEIKVGWDTIYMAFTLRLPQISDVYGAPISRNEDDAKLVFDFAVHQAQYTETPEALRDRILKILNILEVEPN